jgi:hypothetical protein
MSANTNRTTSSAPTTEPWVRVMAFSFLPVLAALFVPEAARIALLALGGVTFLVGFVLMVRHSRRSRDDDSLRQLVHSGSE